MHRSRILVSAFTLALASQIHAVNTVDFEDKSVPQSGYYNGSDQAGQFTSRGASFNNSYDSGFWQGWSYSNVVDATTPGFGNQYASLPGGGSGAAGQPVAGGVYGVAFSFFPNDAFINLPADQTPISLRATNTTYTVSDMNSGSTFSKKFGGPTGNDPDFLSVTFTGYSQLGAQGSTTGSTTFDLADFRFADNAQDYMVNNWRSVDLSGLGSARSIGLSFASSDVGAFGINTPTYVAMDNLTLTPEPAGLLMLSGLASFGLRRRKW